MSWKRLATIVAGGAMVAVGAVIPAAAAVLVPAGVGLVGYALRWPGDAKRIRELESISPPTRKD